MAELIQPLTTIHLSNRAPKLIKESEWPLLVGTPEGDTGLTLLVRTNRGSDGLTRAVVYGTRGAGITGTRGAGEYAGTEISNSTPDLIAGALFAIGSELGIGIKTIWALVQDLPADRL